MRYGKAAIFFFIICFFPLLTYAIRLDNTYMVVEANNKKGLVNQAGDILIPAQYDDIGWSRGRLKVIKNVIGFKKNNLWGLISTKNKIVKEPLYLSLYAVDKYVVAGKKGAYNNVLQYGLLASNGKVLVAFKYANLEPFENYLIASLMNGKQERFGLINLKEKLLLPFRYQEISPLSEHSFALKDFEGKISIYDSKRKEITELQSDDIIHINENQAIISVAGRKGLIDGEGNTIIQPKYKKINVVKSKLANVLPYPQWKYVDINHNSFKNFYYDEMSPINEQLFKAVLDDYELLINDNGDFLRELKGVRIGRFDSDIALLHSKDKVGIINKQGEIVLPVDYDSIQILDDYFLVGKKRISKTDWSIIDRKSKKVINTPPFHEVKALHDDLFAARLDNYWALVNARGKAVTSFKFNSVEPTADGHAQVKLIRQEGVMDKYGQWKVIPRSGKLIYINRDFYITASGFCRFLMYRYGREYYCTQDSLLRRENDVLEINREGKKGLFDLQGNRLLNTRYDFISELQKDSIYIFKKEGLYGIMTRQGEILTEDRDFEKMYEMSEGFIGVKINNSYGFVDPNGDLRIANRYDAILPFSEGFAGIKLLGRWGFVNKLERLKIQPLYQEVTPFEQGLAVVKKNDQWGIIDKEGQEVLRVSYDSLYRLESNRFVSKKNNRYGLISKEGREMVFPKYDSIQDLKNGYVIVGRNNKYGVCNIDGVIEIPIIYETVKYDRDNDKYLVKESSEWETIALE